MQVNDGRILASGGGTLELDQELRARSLKRTVGNECASALKRQEEACGAESLHQAARDRQGPRTSRGGRREPTYDLLGRPLLMALAIGASGSFALRLIRGLHNLASEPPLRRHAS